MFIRKKNNLRKFGYTGKEIMTCYSFPNGIMLNDLLDQGYRITGSSSNLK